MQSAGKRLPARGSPGDRWKSKLRSGLSDTEFSITVYHEILEAITVASDNPPGRVTMFNEGDFERAARMAHQTFGRASPDNLDQMLQQYGF